MTLLRRHIVLRVLGGVGIVLLVFLSLVSVFSLVEELAEDDAGYTASTAFTYVALTLPRRAYEVLPFAAFIGALVGLGQLAGNNELMVMRASGYSVMQIFGAVAIAALVVLGFGVGIGELVAPDAEERAATLKARAGSTSDTLFIDGGHWYREGPLYLNVDGIADGDTLHGVVLYEVGAENHLQRVRWAERATYEPRTASRETNHIWVLHNVVETDFSQGVARTQNYAEYAWHSAADPRLLSARALLDPRRMALGDLFYQVAYMQREGLSPVRYQLALWGKLLQPFAVLGLCLLALTFILGPLRERGIGLRLSVGVLVGLVFKYLQDLFGPVSMVYGLPAWLGVAIPIAVCWVLGFIGVRRIG